MNLSSVDMAVPAESKFFDYSIDHHATYTKMKCSADSMVSGIMDVGGVGGGWWETRC